MNDWVGDVDGEGIKGIELECGLKSVGVRVERKY